MSQRIEQADQLEASRQYVRDIASRRGSFAVGMRLVPEPNRSAIYALYAWMRQADDLADDPGSPDPPADLQRFWDRTQAALNGGGPPDSDPTPLLWPAFAEAANRYAWPKQHLADLIAGQEMDLSITRYDTFEQLYEYCYRVASTVGLLCIQTWGYQGGQDTLRLAEYRGIAFQLTNILRDVHEDARRGRIYLPLGAAGLTPEDIVQNRRPEVVLEAMARIIDRARDFYESSGPLEGLVERPGRASLRAMTRVYRALLERIAKNPGQVLAGRRVGIPRWQKAWIAMRAMLRC